MLDKRLSVCADFVKGDKVCDVGTDHAYLVSELLLEGRCKFAVAVDINEKPLASARTTLEKNNLLVKTEIVLSNGLENVNSDGITDIVIAGMGGELIANILSECDWLENINLILQPMTQAAYLYRWLAENGFYINEQKAVIDDRHSYMVINAIYDGVEKKPDVLDEQIGKLDTTDENAVEYIKRQALKILRAGYGMRDSGRVEEGIDNISLAHKMIFKTGGNIMFTVKDIFAEVDKIAPIKNLHKDDNSGLLVGDVDLTVTKVLTALDITCDVVREAVEKKAQVIIAHHPVIYNPLYTLNDNNPACLALKNNIACICYHSPLDMADGGINDIIYDMLKNSFGLSKPNEVLEPVLADGRGYGMVCNAAVLHTPAEMADKLKDIFDCFVVRYTNGSRPIKKIAFCSGGAGFNIHAAIKLGADAFITGDVKHDQLITAKNEGVSIFDCGHYHTEVIAMEYIKKCFNMDFPDLDIEIAQACVDPAEYAI